MEDDKADLDSFLSKVSEIETCIKQLNAEDDDAKTAAISEADKLIHKYGGKTEPEPQGEMGTVADVKKKYPPRDNTGVNRSVVNQVAFDKIGQEEPPQPDPNMGQEAFMAAMERDAAERAARRKAARAQADEIKLRGNESFKCGDYQAAADLYSQALDVFKDYSALWTNRAQAYIKLGKFTEAIDDCDWALRVHENCVKAHITRGRAFLALQKFDEAQECFETALKCEPGKEKAINEYLHDVELARRAHEEEASAAAFLSSGSIEGRGVVHLLEKVQAPDQLTMYYTGGLRLLTQALHNTNERTLFRTHGGLQLTTQHKLIARCFAASPRSLSREELDLVASTLFTLAAAVTNNEESGRLLLTAADLPQQLLRLLESKMKHSREVKTAALSLLHTLSQMPAPRAKLVQVTDISKLLSCVFSLMKGKGINAVNATGLLNNIALDDKFRASMRQSIDQDVLPAFESLMVEGSSNAAVLPAAISTVTNLSSDAVIRAKLIARQQMWHTCDQTLEKHVSDTDSCSSDVVYSTLGLLNNMCVSPSDNLRNNAVPICKHCLKLLQSKHERLVERSTSLVSRLTPVSAAAASAVLAGGGVDSLLHLLKCREETGVVKAAVKALAGCTSHLPAARTAVVNYRVDKTGLKILADLLKLKDETIVGNSALCLSHCVDGNAEVCSKFVKTNIIQDLLVLARDCHDKTTQHNCAILTAKLVQADTRHLERLRELHGTEILHDVLNQVNKH